MNESFSLRFVLPAVVLCWVGAYPTRAITADDAGDVCAATADPCEVTSTVDIVSGAVLDFGARALVVKNSGKLNFGMGSAEIRSGTLTLMPWSYPRMVVRANGGAAQGWVGGSALVVARGKCSTDATRPCLTDVECQPGGTCGTTSGNIVVDGEVEGWGNPGGSVELVARGAVTTTKPINVGNGNIYEDGNGGSVEIKTYNGSVVLDSLINVHGGNSAHGGSITINSATDLTLNAQINAIGGSDDGGEVSLEAGRDVFINAAINTYPDYGDGSGGGIAVSAGRHISIAASQVINSKGRKSVSTGELGDGGDQEYAAKGNITLGTGVQLLANSPDTTAPAHAGTVEVRGCTLTVNSGVKIESQSQPGGFVELGGGDAVVVSATALIKATGTAGSVRLKTREVTSNNPNTNGTQSQFTPAPLTQQDSTLPSCL